MRLGINCSRCLTFVGYGREVEPGHRELWVEACDRCRARDEREAEAQAEVETTPELSPRRQLDPAVSG